MGGNSRESVGKEAAPGHERHKRGSSACSSRRPQCVCSKAAFFLGSGVHEFRDTGRLSPTPLRGPMGLQRKEHGRWRQPGKECGWLYMENCVHTQHLRERQGRRRRPGVMGGWWPGSGGMPLAGEGIELALRSQEACPVGQQGPGGTEVEGSSLRQGVRLQTMRACQ